jgi:hypothetical protein
METESDADPNASAIHRRGTPLHYAADEFITGTAWDLKRQIKTINCLIALGARIVSRTRTERRRCIGPLRIRCAQAIQFLRAPGADPLIGNNSGSTAFRLVVQNTGRGGSGEPLAIDAQKEIA